MARYTNEELLDPSAKRREGAKRRYAREGEKERTGEAIRRGLQERKERIFVARVRAEFGPDKIGKIWMPDSDLIRIFNEKFQDTNSALSRLRFLAQASEKATEASAIEKTLVHI